MSIEKIISGGQTGVDRAALDVAITLGFPHGGWIPAGRWAEDGRIHKHYNLQETPSSETAQRTEWNVRDSDATLIISNGALQGGTLLTLELAIKYNNSCLHIELSVVTENEGIKLIADWLESKDCKILNVAGPRSSEDSEIYRQTYELLMGIFAPAHWSARLTLHKGASPLSFSQVKPCTPSAERIQNA